MLYRTDNNTQRKRQPGSARERNQMPRLLIVVGEEPKRGKTRRELRTGELEAGAAKCRPWQRKRLAKG